MAGREISVRKYVVKLSAKEREQLEAMICAGKHPAQSLTKARILLKADVSEAGEGWSDSAISAALDTSINNIGRTRRRLVEEGIAAALTRKYNPNSARPRIFDGAAEAKLIALTCSPAPEGFARWSLRLLDLSRDREHDGLAESSGLRESLHLSARMLRRPSLELRRSARANLNLVAVFEKPRSQRLTRG